MDDAAALSAKPGQLKGLQKQLANRDASVKQQLQEAAEAKSEKERKRTPESEADARQGWRISNNRLRRTLNARTLSGQQTPSHPGGRIQIRLGRTLSVTR